MCRGPASWLLSGLAFRCSLPLCSFFSGRQLPEKVGAAGGSSSVGVLAGSLADTGNSSVALRRLGVMKSAAACSMGAAGDAGAMSSPEASSADEAFCSKHGGSPAKEGCKPSCSGELPTSEMGDSHLGVPG